MNPARQTKVLAIDPATRRLGWAVFHGELLDSSGVIVLGTRDGDWLERSDMLADKIAALVTKRHIDHVIIEQPMQFHGSARGMQAMDSGSVMKLMALVMAIRTLVKALTTASVDLVPVIKWKGQTPKTVTMSRMEKRYRKKFVDDNEADAVGIGDWYIRIRPTMRS